jgi:hypothetical protein
MLQRTSPIGLAFQRGTLQLPAYAGLCFNYQGREIMKTSQLLISTIAAASVVGAIGFANAQSSTTPTTPVPQTEQLDRSTTTSPDATRDNATMNNTAPRIDTLQRNDELPPQADRN